MLDLAPGAGLAWARAHEATGPARTVFALVVAGQLAGPVLWLQPDWVLERPMGDGVRGFLDPGRLIFGRARTAAEILWAAEEALRTGLVPLVVAELPAAPGLTAVRRLHLAAETGAVRGTAPLALLLTPDAGGSAGHRDPLARRPRARLGPRRRPALAADPAPRPHGARTGLGDAPRGRQGAARRRLERRRHHRSEGGHVQPDLVGPERQAAMEREAHRDAHVGGAGKLVDLDA